MVLSSNAKHRVLVIHGGSTYIDQLLTYLEQQQFTVTEVNFDVFTDNLEQGNKKSWSTIVQDYEKARYDAVIYAGGAIRESRVPGLYQIIKLWSMRLIRDLTVPYLGICLGHMMLGFAYGATYHVMRRRRERPILEEKGVTRIRFHSDFPLAPGKRSLQVYEDHERELARLPRCLINTASSQDCKIQAIYHITKPQFGVQFHPEVMDTKGHLVLETFVTRIQSQI